MAVLAVVDFEHESRRQLEGKVRQRAELVANMVNYAAESVSGSGEVTLKPKVAMAMVGRRSIA